MESLQVLFAHRNRLVRECLRSALEAKGCGASVVDHSQLPLWRTIDTAGTQFAFIDLALPDRLALDLVRYLWQLAKGCKLVLLIPAVGLPDNLRQRMLECVELGVHGYIHEEASLDELSLALDQIQRGATYCSPQIVESLFADFAAMAKTSGWKQRVISDQLTRREAEVLQWMTEGLSNKQIAKRLSVSLHTVKNHVHRILKKLKADDRFAADRMAQMHDPSKIVAI